MISFIVIGYNEGHKLKTCFKSIYKCVEFNRLPSYEVIYVDSKSDDKSLEIVKEFPSIKAFTILGDCNAAIGRNIGAIEAKGSILFFVDADIHLRQTVLLSRFA